MHKAVTTSLTLTSIQAQHICYYYMRTEKKVKLEQNGFFTHHGFQSFSPAYLDCETH